MDVRVDPVHSSFPARIPTAEHVKRFGVDVADPNVYHYVAISIVSLLCLRTPTTTKELHGLHERFSHASFLPRTAASRQRGPRSSDESSESDDYPVNTDVIYRFDDLNWSYSLEPGPTWLLIVLGRPFLATRYDKEPGGAGFEATGASITTCSQFGAERMEQPRQTTAVFNVLLCFRHSVEFFCKTYLVDLQSSPTGLELFSLLFFSLFQTC